MPRCQGSVPPLTAGGSQEVPRHEIKSVLKQAEVEVIRSVASAFGCSSSAKRVAGDDCLFSQEMHMHKVRPLFRRTKTRSIKFDERAAGQGTVAT